MLSTRQRWPFSRVRIACRLQRYGTAILAEMQCCLFPLRKFSGGSPFSLARLFHIRYFQASLLPIRHEVVAYET
jgi:hypothetical protein